MADLEGAPWLEVTVRDLEGAPVIAVSGELDFSTIATLRNVLDSQLKAKPGALRIDLSGVNFMDSSGLAVLITARRSVDSMRLLNPSPRVRSLIDLTGLAGLLVMEP